MSVEENKAISRRIFEEAFNKGNLAVADEHIATNYVYHGPVGMEYKGTEGLKQLATMYRTAFPDLHITIDDVVAEGDKVVTRFTLRGTFKGEMMGMAPTGKQVTITGAVFSHFVSGKEVEAFPFIDMLDMYQQLGVNIPGQ